MTVYLAEKTLATINAAIAADNGARFRALQREILPKLEDAYSEEQEEKRSHLGASIMGEKCDRALFYKWRWALTRPPEGKRGENATVAHSRMVRLWNRGHLEEGRLIALLLMINVQFYASAAHDAQFKFHDFGGHFSGSLDAAICNVPDFPSGMWALGEFKTWGSKYWAPLLKSGIREAEFKHYVQMQLYMKYANLPAALYLAINKDTEELYGELVPYEERVGVQYSARARDIIFARSKPARIRNASPGNYICRLCNQRDVCFGAVGVDRNCRTCAHVDIRTDGKFHCTLRQINLDKAAQITGCGNYTADERLK